ncbi:MAG TPA: tail fiber protein [Opitutaceae bacterium]|nr:tail fiber protein [Opitutaceae bacterium]
MHFSRITKIMLVLGTLACGTHLALAQTEPFLGEIRMVGFNFAPQGWALCNGQTLSISQNTALFSLLGTQFGGNGTSTFCLPNLQGRFPLGAGTGSYGTYYNGESGGAEVYTLTVAQLPAHAHPLMASTDEATAVSPTGNTLASKARVPLYTTSAPNTMMNSASVGATGGNQPYEVMPPYQVVTFIIALQGIYPSRS